MKALSKISNEFKLTEDIEKSAIELLEKYDRTIVAEHVSNVAETSYELADKFGEDKEKAKIAGYLHDISAVIKNDEKIAVCRELDIEILEVEEICPPVIHQKLSKAMARDLFDIQDEDILSAIECHTTLKKNASNLDMIVFIADKISWDQAEEPPYLESVKDGLKKSLERGVFEFINYQLNNKQNLLVIHPWLEEAYFDLSKKLGLSE